jgi:hypothetical protein
MVENVNVGKCRNLVEIMSLDDTEGKLDISQKSGNTFHIVADSPATLSLINSAGIVSGTRITLILDPFDSISIEQGSASDGTYHTIVFVGSSGDYSGYVLDLIYFFDTWRVISSI